MWCTEPWQIFSSAATSSVITCQLFFLLYHLLHYSVRPVCSMKSAGLSCIYHIWRHILKFLMPFLCLLIALIFLPNLRSDRPHVRIGVNRWVYRDGNIQVPARASSRCLISSPGYSLIGFCQLELACVLPVNHEWNLMMQRIKTPHRSRTDLFIRSFFFFLMNALLKNMRYLAVLDSPSLQWRTRVPDRISADPF